jgi:hypothetical protein
MRTAPSGARFSLGAINAPGGALHRHPSPWNQARRVTQKRAPARTSQNKHELLFGVVCLVDPARVSGFQFSLKTKRGHMTE